MGLITNVLLWFFLCCCFGQLQVTAQFRPQNFIEGLSDATNSISDFLSSMIWPKCEYRPDIVETVKNKLQEVIKGQDEGIDLILNSLRAWEFQRLLGIHQPFVMAITGPTGVGKTETSYQIANALFPTHKYSNSMSKPCGFLSLRGEDYSNSSDLFATGINNMQRVIRQRIASHLQQSNGNAVILVDEVQKIQPGVMEVFIPMLDPRGSLTYVDYEEPNTYANKARSYLKMFQSTGKSSQKNTKTSATMVCENGEDDSESCEFKDQINDLSQPYHEGMVQVTKEISTQNVIFIFASDIGVKDMIRLLLKYGDRRSIPIVQLRSDIKYILDEQWDRLMLGKTVKEVVPYLPLEHSHVRDILVSKLETGNKLASERHLWLSMVVDEDVADYLSGKRFIDYEKYSHGNVQKSFATRGARALENAGPLKDLNGMIGRFMSPWKPTEIFHVGLITERNLERSRKLWKNEQQQAKNTYMYFQWCLPDPCLFSQANFTGLIKEGEDQDYNVVNRLSKLAKAEECSKIWSSGISHSNSPGAVSENRAGIVREFLQYATDKGQKAPPMVISDDYTFSSLCDTVWFGSFPAV